MKILFIGGTGTISRSISLLLATQGHEVTLLNRGTKSDTLLPDSIRRIYADIHDEKRVSEMLSSLSFDVVCDFIAFRPEDVRRDIRLFGGRCGQFIFISSASAYQKPLSHHVITESTPLSNPYWQYSRDKIACEEILMEAYRTQSFPITLVRPSHTYAFGSVPLAIHSPHGVFTDLSRMLAGKPILVPGDGNSLWTVTHSDDFARGFVGLLSNPHALGEAVHITSDESLTWNQIYEIVGSALGVKPILYHIASDRLIRSKPELEGPLLGDKSHSVVFDNSKIKRLTKGFCAGIRFDQGIRISLPYLLENKNLQVFDEEWDAWEDSLIRQDS